MFAWFEGKKTYILSAAAILYGVAGWYTGNLTQDAALGVIGAALGFSTLRHGVSTSAK